MGASETKLGLVAQTGLAMLGDTLDELFEAAVLYVDLSPLGNDVFIEIACKLHGVDNGRPATATVIPESLGERVQSGMR